MDRFQSAHREGHSTETALLRVQNDILMELDKGKVVMLVCDSDKTLCLNSCLLDPLLVYFVASCL